MKAEDGLLSGLKENKNNFHKPIFIFVTQVELSSYDLMSHEFVLDMQRIINNKKHLVQT